jgi:AcrR family transcriptional regulator
MTQQRKATAQAKSTPVTDGPRKRRPYRREQILASAVQLFHERGYHATGIDDIGGAAGISGPGVYRHYANKEAILADAIVKGVGESQAKIEEIVSSSDDPKQMIERLARNSVRAITNNPSIAAIVLFEQRILAPETREFLDQQGERNIKAWSQPLMKLRPELSTSEARLLVLAVWRLLETPIQHQSGLSRKRLEEVLVDMVLKALLSPSLLEDRGKPSDD